MIATVSHSYGVPGVVAVVVGMNARTADLARKASRAVFQQAVQQRRAGKHDIAERNLEKAEHISRLAR